MIRHNTPLFFVATFVTLFFTNCDAFGSHNWHEMKRDNEYSVVMIKNYIKIPNEYEPFKDPQEARAHGSGFIIDISSFAQGTTPGNIAIVTNYHVVENSEQLNISLPEVDRSAEFKVILQGCRPESDIAILAFTEESLEEFTSFLKKVPGRNGIIDPVILGDSNELHSAQEVMAIGYPYAYEQKSSIGHVSGVSLSFGSLMYQVTTPINPGNSGGPMFNDAGQVIGINSAKHPEKGADNIGYIIPINYVKNILSELCRHGGIVRFHTRQDTIQGTILGAIMQPTTDNLLKAFDIVDDTTGVLVTYIHENTPAASAGLQVGDIVTEINGHEIDKDGCFWHEIIASKVPAYSLVQEAPVGSTLDISFIRNKEKKATQITIPATIKYGVDHRYTSLEGIDYLAIGGIILQPMNMNISDLLERYSAANLAVNGMKYLYDPTYRNKQRLVVSKIYPLSQASREKGLPEGSVIKTVNGVQVETLEEFIMTAQNNTHNGYIIIETEHGGVAALNIEKLIIEDELYRTSQHYEESELIAALKSL